MNNLYFSLIVLLYLSKTVSSFRFSLSPEYKNIKLCRSRNIDCQNSMDPKIRLRYYQLQYSQCTHIIGNLVLCNLQRTENGTDPDLSFLESIREVSGYVFISENEVKRIPLTSLRIIRGRVPYEVKGTGKGSLVLYRNARNSSIGLEILDLRSLTTIQNHDIIMWDNPLLCHFAYRVDYPALFPSSSQQVKLGLNSKFVSQSGCIYDKVLCHPSCTRYSSEEYCWGPNKGQCQLQAKCKDNPSRYCLMPGSHDVKCDDACIGGCTERTSNCWACQEKLNGETCVGSCPAKMIVGEISSRQEPNPDFKYDLHNICVKKCPAPFLKMDSVCVIECDFKTTIPVNGSCEPCDTSPCATHCTKDQLFGQGFPLLTSAVAKKMEKCAYYTGPIYVNSKSFKKFKGAPLLKMKDLWNLRNLKEVVGYIYLDLKDAPKQLTNLTFLMNLYRVTAEFGTGHSLGIALSIYNGDNVEFLGMKKLRYMDTEAFMEKMPALCYKSGLENIVEFRTKMVKHEEACTREGHVCHSECLPFTGCWGPGPSMCAHCCGFQAGEQCVSECSEASGFYTPPGLVTRHSSGKSFHCPTLPLSPEEQAIMEREEIHSAIVPAQQCARCHEECAETCSGPENTECVGPCKHVLELGRCVSACSPSYYLDASSKKCLSCHEICWTSVENQILPEGVAACSGPGKHLGLGGCSFCQFIRKDNDTGQYTCLANGCPQEHFGKVTHLTELDIKLQEQTLDNRNVANLDIKECEPCHPLCESCVGQGTHESVCFKCRKWTYKSECVETCPSDDTYMPSENATAEGLSSTEAKALAKRECLMCHRQCAGGCFGSGPDHCRNCRFAKIITDLKTSQFICNSTCPPEQPYKMDNMNLCVDKTQYDIISGVNKIKSRNIILIGIGLTILVILIFAIIMTLLCFNYKAKKTKIKESVMSEYANITAPDMKNQAAAREPNMARLEMISSDDLSFEDKDLPIGVGAFGAVFRGKWQVPKRIAAEFSWPRTTSLDVAIKVIRSSTSTGGTGTHDQTDSGGSETNAYERVSQRNNLSEMLSEAKVMASVQHKNCLRLIGVCIQRKMHCMVSAFVELGSLDRYLREYQEELDSFTLLSWAEQIADGMAYLEARGIIHRDLAARNVLVQSTSLVQITDFGLAKMLDRCDEDSIVVPTGRVPIRWLAIETLQSGIYSHKTDVWSYGVTLWEIFTYGKQPYEDVKTTDIKDHVMKGGRLTQPDICTLDAYMAMVKCWMEDYESRPTFLELMTLFHNFCQTPGRYLYIQGDKYEINRSVPYTPSPAPWLQLAQIRGIPDGIAGDRGSGSNGNAKAFRFSESHLRTEPVTPLYGYGANRPLPPRDDEGEDEGESLLPHRRAGGRTPGSAAVGSLGRMWRRLELNSNNSGPPTNNASQSTISTSQLPTPTVGPDAHPMRTYYNTDQIHGTPCAQPTGVYGGWVHPPSSTTTRQAPTGAPRAEPEVDVGDDECFTPRAQPPLEDYLEPRTNPINPNVDQRTSGDGSHRFLHPRPWQPPAQIVENPEYFGQSGSGQSDDQQDYLQPKINDKNPVA